jgi:hypothetical protein
VSFGAAPRAATAPGFCPVIRDKPWRPIFCGKLGGNGSSPSRNTTAGCGPGSVATGVSSAMRSSGPVCGAGRENAGSAPAWRRRRPAPRATSTPIRLPWAQSLRLVFAPRRRIPRRARSSLPHPFSP